MDENGDGEDLTPFWLQSTSKTQHTGSLRRRVSSFFSSMLVVLLLSVTALFFLVYVVPSALSFSAQIFRPNSVKKSWDSLNMVLVLVAVLFGFLTRIQNEDRYSYYDESQLQASPNKQIESQRSEPTHSDQWYSHNYSTVEGPKANTTSVSNLDSLNEHSDYQMKLENKDPFFTRNSSSYTDLREFSSNRRDFGDYRRGFYDDLNVDTGRVPDPVKFGHRRHRSVEEIDSLRAVQKNKTIFVDTLVGRSKEATHSSLASSPPLPTPAQPPALPEYEEKQQSESVARREKSLRGKQKKDSEPMNPIFVDTLVGRSKEATHSSLASSPPLPTPAQPPALPEYEEKQQSESVARREKSLRGKQKKDSEPMNPIFVDTLVGRSKEATHSSLASSPPLPTPAQPPALPEYEEKQQSESVARREKRLRGKQKKDSEPMNPIFVDTLVGRSKDATHSSLASFPPLPTPAQPPALPEYEEKQQSESVARREKRLRGKQEKDSEPMNPITELKSPQPMPSPPTSAQPPAQRGAEAPVFQEMTKREHQNSRHSKARPSRKLNEDLQPKASSTPPQPPTPPQEKISKSGSATKDFLNSLYHKKKKERRQKSVENLDPLLHQAQEPISFQLPPPTASSSKPTAFQNLFLTKKQKRKRTISVRLTPTPPPQPPPPPRTKAKEPKPTSQTSPLSSHMPQSDTKLKMFEKYAETSNSGGESPLNRIPPPPPPPPTAFFKNPAWKFVVQGDYVRINSSTSSRSESPDINDVDSDATPSADEMTPFQNLFLTKKQKRKRTISVRLTPTPPPPPPPPPPPRRTKAKEPKPTSQTSPLSSHRPPSATKMKMFEKYAETSNSGGESPLNRIPPPPPPPPTAFFKNPAWKFVVEGDYVRVNSSTSSRSESPDINDVDSDATPSADAMTPFQKLFLTKKQKRKRTISVRLTPTPPPPPPPPPPRRTKAKEPKPTSQTSPLSSHRPPSDTKLKMFEKYAETSNSGGESPLNRIPPPPPPPPTAFFKNPAWKFVVEGDYVRVNSSTSSRSESPDINDVDSDATPSADEGAMTPSHPSPLSCQSPDVNTEAESFISSFRAKLKLEKFHSMNGRQLGLSSLGPGLGPGQGPNPI